MSSCSIDIPKKLPVMTLRGMVLFPKAMMPLRIFEERYRIAFLRMGIYFSENEIHEPSKLHPSVWQQ